MAKKARKVRKPHATDAKHRHASAWRAEDEVTLRYAIDGQLTHLNEQILRANSPGKKAKLRDRKKELLAMRKKVDNGLYGSTALYAKLERMGIKPEATGKGSVSRYDTMDFKFDEYFRKTRYYGVMLPFLIIIFVVLMIFLLSLGSILPTSVDSALNPVSSEEETVFSFHIDSLYMFKLSPQNDFLIKNDGKWPLGLWAEGKELEGGELYKDSTGNTPTTVRVYAELGMTAVKLSIWDVANAFFRTSAMSSYRIDPIENLPVFDGADWYYAKYIMNQDEFLSFGKQADGTYNTSNLIYIIAVYGTIIAIIGLLICAVCAIVSSIVSMFTFTGRRLHVYAIFSIIFLAIALILPAFLAISSGVEPKDCLSTYFTFNDATFLSEDGGPITVNFPIIFAFIPAVLTLLMPKFFKNKASKLPTYVPKGNRPPTAALVERAQQNANNGGQAPRPQQQRPAGAPYPAMGRPMGSPMPYRPSNVKR